jgi:ATP-dependent DNA helicase PIF1
MESSIEQIESWALHSLQDALAKSSKMFEDFGLLAPFVAFDWLETNCLLEVEHDYNVEVLQTEVAMAIKSLNDGQHAVHNGVIDADATHHVKVIFIDDLGGTNKTYTENLILNVVCLRGDIALVVASLGIVALLFLRRQMTHSYLKIPIALNHTSFYCIHKQDDLVALIRQMKLILWDEAPMTNKLTFEVVDQTLRDLADRNETFGGIVFVMLGDFC